jgi:hypothetical protein
MLEQTSGIEPRRREAIVKTYREAERNESTDFERIDSSFAVTDDDSEVSIVGRVVPGVRKFLMRFEMIAFRSRLSSTSRLSLGILISQFRGGT